MYVFLPMIFFCVCSSTANQICNTWTKLAGKRVTECCVLDEKLVDNEQSYSWLKSGDIK